MTNYSFTNFTEVIATNDKENDINLFDVFIFLPLSVFGFIGNILICIIIVENTHMHTSMNCYLLSLAVSDILAIVCFIGSTVLSLESWGGIIIVQLNNYIRGTSYAAYILIILAITVDRYIAVCHPFMAQSMFTIPRTIKIILSIWICALIYVVGLENICNEVGVQPCDKTTKEWNLIFVLNFSLSFFIPFISMTIMYALIGLNIWRSSRTDIGNQDRLEERRSSAKKGLLLSVTVVAEFFICQGPMYLASFLEKFQIDFTQTGWIVFVIMAMILHFSYAIIDPIIYCFVSSTFRQAYKELLWSSIRRCNHLCSTRQIDDRSFVMDENNI